MADNPPTTRDLIFIPAVITLAITLARLVGELMNAPGWLASRESGGGGALLGISYLPPILGIYFATRLSSGARPFWRLAKTMLAYGVAARVPVILITYLALAMNWGTHFERFGEGGEPDGALTLKNAGMTLVAQLGFWIVGWTLVSGMLTGSITLWLKRRSAKASSAPA